MSDDRLMAGIELGGTKAIALIARGRDIIAQARFPTETPAITLAKLADQLDAWTAEHGSAEALGIASFGPVGLDRSRADYGHITSTPKPGWANTDVVGHFARALDVPIRFDTDVAGAALAEHRWGAAQRCAVAIYLTIGTGVGGGLVIDGQPVHGAMHPEIGHLWLRRARGDTFAGVCPFHGDCIEGLVSGPALAARFEGPPARVPDDDPRWAPVASDLAELSAAILLTTSAQRILIGGGVGLARTKLLDTVRALLVERIGGYLPFLDSESARLIVRAPELGDRAGPLGAIALAWSALRTGEGRTGP